MRHLPTCLILLCLALLVPSFASAAAAPLVFFDNDGFGPTNPRGLYNFDTESRTVSLRVPVAGAQSFRAMDRRPSDGRCYAVDLNGGLWTIDLDTGATSLVGNTGVSSLVGLAIRPTTGEFFGFRVSDPGGYLYRIDPATAAATQIGFSQVDGGLAFAPDGTLYGLDGDLVHVMNTATGASQRVVIPSYNVPLNGLRAGDGAFTADGRYFVNEWMGYISEVDPADGSGERLASNVLGGGMGAMVAVPEPGAIVLLAAGAVCLLLCRRDCQPAVVRAG